MQLLQNTVINTTFGFFAGIMVYFKYIGILKSNLDHMLAVLAIFVSVLLLFFKSIWALDLAHFLYCVVYLFTVSFLSKNSYLLGLNVLMIGLIIFTRYYYGVCILNKKQKNKGFFTDLNSIVKIYVSFWNWDYIFPLLFIVSSYKFIKHI
tara:strand:+ start:125 stop:574 length:450 start_codon:yes stop_codon:yes gene_type:complete